MPTRKGGVSVCVLEVVEREMVSDALNLFEELPHARRSNP